MGVHIAVDHTADGYMLLENGVMTALLIYAAEDCKCSDTNRVYH